MAWEQVKYIYKNGDQRDLYVVGEDVTFKWHVRWQITGINYDDKKERTCVKLVKKDLGVQIKLKSL